jgi:ABC-type glutathione transport system ATPase component
MIAGVLEPSAGTIRYAGIDITDRRTDEAKRAGLRIQMIFQDPFASLNPRMRIADIVGSCIGTPSNARSMPTSMTCAACRPRSSHKTAITSAGTPAHRCGAGTRGQTRFSGLR